MQPFDSFASSVIAASPAVARIVIHQPQHTLIDRRRRLGERCRRRHPRARGARQTTACSEN